MTKTITARDIYPKPYKRFGIIIYPKEINTYHSDIIPKQSIRLYGIRLEDTKNPIVFDKTFKIGDYAEYDSYNLNYIGKIIAIGPKTITIKDHNEKHRLDLHTFAWRNWNFDAKKISEENTNTMMRI